MALHPLMFRQCEVTRTRVCERSARVERHRSREGSEFSRSYHMLQSHLSSCPLAPQHRSQLSTPARPSVVFISLTYHQLHKEHTPHHHLLSLTHTQYTHLSAFCRLRVAHPGRRQRLTHRVQQNRLRPQRVLIPRVALWQHSKLLCERQALCNMLRRALKSIAALMAERKLST